MIVTGTETRGAADFLKLMLSAAALLFLSSVGEPLLLVPTAVLLVGLLLSFHSGSTSPIKLTTRVVQIGGALFALISSAVLEFDVLSGGNTPHQVEIPVNDYVAVFHYRAFHILLLTMYIVSVLAVEYLWFKPLSRQFANVSRELGAVVHSFRRLISQSSRAGVPKIMARETLASYSTADELEKWSKLHQKGAISDQEFAGVRAKMLGS